MFLEIDPECKHSCVALGKKLNLSEVRAETIKKGMMRTSTPQGWVIMNEMIIERSVNVGVFLFIYCGLTAQCVGSGSQVPDQGTRGQNPHHLEWKWTASKVPI